MFDSVGSCGAARKACDIGPEDPGKDLYLNPEVRIPFVWVRFDALRVCVVAQKISI